MIYNEFSFEVVRLQCYYNIFKLGFSYEDWWHLIGNKTIKLGSMKKTLETLHINDHPFATLFFLLFCWLLNILLRVFFEAPRRGKIKRVLPFCLSFLFSISGFLMWVFFFFLKPKAKKGSLAILLFLSFYSYLESPHMSFLWAICSYVLSFDPHIQWAI